MLYRPDHLMKAAGWNQRFAGNTAARLWFMGGKDII
jgi:hypothetical protein